MSVYEPTPWVNDSQPALNEDNLNHAERGTNDASKELGAIGLGTIVVAEAEVCGEAENIAHATETVVGAIKMYTVEDSATNEIIGYIDSGVIGDLPNAVIDFEASDRLPGMVRIDFSLVSHSLSYNLYRDSLLVASGVLPGHEYPTDGGTWDFYVTSINLVGEVVGNIDEGTARAIPTDVPAEITDFTASDDRVQSVEFNWTDHYDAYRFDLYSGTTLIQDSIVPGQVVIIAESTHSYHIEAVNHLGTTVSNSDEGVSTTMMPSAITDLTATLDQTAKITFTFSPVAQPALYDLYKDGVLHRSNVYSGYEMASPGGSWPFYVRAVNSLGSANSNEVIGTSVAAQYPPEAVEDLLVTDDEVRSMAITFTPSLDAERFDLYRSDYGLNTFTIYESDVFPNYTFDSLEGTWDFMIVAVNSVGETDGNIDSGTARAFYTVPPVAVLDFTVSTELINSILVGFTEDDNTARYDLFRDGQPYKTGIRNGQSFQTFSGEWDFFIRSHNPIGSADCLPVAGIALPSDSVPGAIAEFTASEGEPNLINFTFTASENAARYDLYKDNRKIRTNVNSPYSLPSPEGEWLFFVRAINLVGTTDSPSDIGSAVLAPQPPDEITNFLASDALRGEVQMTFSHAEYAVTYDLYEDDILVEVGISPGYIYDKGVAGTWSYYVIANNTIGSTPSNSDIGIALDLLQPPTVIDDFRASDGQLDKVVIDFTPATNADSHDLYRNENLEQQGVDPLFELAITGPNTSSYFVRAINADHTTDSNSDNGTSATTEAGSVDIIYNSFTFTGNGELTVTVLDGVGTFTPPPGTTYVFFDMLGGGGSGCVNGGGNAGGGYHGEILCGLNADVTPGVSIDFLIEPSVAGVYGSSVNGTTGGIVSFGSFGSALGGAGGTSGGYPGDSGATTTCFGTQDDGNGQEDYDGVWGWGGQSSGYGVTYDGGGYGANAWGSDSAGAADGDGSGGGGLSLYASSSTAGTSGAGKSGMIRISWG